MDAEAFSTFTVVSASFKFLLLEMSAVIDRQTTAPIDPQAGVRPSSRITLAAAGIADGGDRQIRFTAIDVDAAPGSRSRIVHRLKDNRLGRCSGGVQLTLHLKNNPSAPWSGYARA